MCVYVRGVLSQSQSQSHLQCYCLILILIYTYRVLVLYGSVYHVQCQPHVSRGYCTIFYSCTIKPANEYGG